MYLKNNNNRGLRFVLYLLLSVALITLVTFRPIGIDADSQAYLEAYDAFRQGNITIIEPTFNLFSFLGATFFGGKGITFVFFLYAIVAISLKIYVVQKYSKSPILSLTVYLCMFYILHEITQIRAGAAAAFFLLALPDLINGNKKHYIFKVLIACTFHLSAMLLLPLSLLSNKKINFFAVFFVPLICLCTVLALGDVSNLLINVFGYFPGVVGEKAIAYIKGVQLYGRFDNVNIFSKITISTYFIFIIYFSVTIMQKKYQQEDVIYLKLFSIMLSVFYVLSSVPVLASRTFELLSASFILSFPQFITKFNPKIIPALLLFLWLLIYLYVVNLKLIGL